MSCYASCLDTPKPCEPCEFESIVRLIFLRRVIMFEEAVELGSWQALTMNSTLTHLFLRLGLAKSNWFENFETPKKTWQGLSSCFNPRVWMRNDRPFVSICHLARCNNFIDDEGAIHLASALETGCAWTRHSFIKKKQRFKRGWDNPWSNSFERFEDVLVDFLWVRCTIHSVSSKWLCSCLETRGRNPNPLLQILTAFHSNQNFTQPIQSLNAGSAGCIS